MTPRTKTATPSAAAPERRSPPAPEHRPAKRPRWTVRFDLATKITLACVLLICAPLALAWAMGAYDEVVGRQVEHDLDLANEELLDAIAENGGATLDDASWLDAYAKRHGLFVRVLDDAGEALRETDPDDAEGRVWSTGWRRHVADFFFGPDGPPSLRVFEGELGPVGDRDEVSQARSDAVPTTIKRTSAGSALQVFYRVVPLTDHHRIVYLARASRRSVRALYDFRFQILKLTLVLLVGAVVMAVWLRWSILGPLTRLQKSVRRQLIDGDAGSLAMPRSDEIGELSRDFDALADRLQGRLEHTARVTADFAHDLKNPLASITALSELLDGDGPLDADRRARLATAAHDAATHMGRSVEAMLVLARLEEELPREKRESVDLARLVTREAARLQDSTPHEVTVVVADAATVWGVERRLAEMVQNLTDNALVFAASHVHMTVTVEPQHIHIDVEDDGPGVSPGNRSKVFARFFTHRPATAPHGTGLGLPISRTIAEAHGGSIDLAEPSPLGGARFRIALPRTR